MDKKDEGPFMSYAQVWELVNGRKPTPEELQYSRQRCLIILNELKLSLSDSREIWHELDNP